MLYTFYRLLTIHCQYSAFDITSNKVWDSWNQGVCEPLSRLQYPRLGPMLTISLTLQRQWKDIKHRYMVKEEEDDE